MRAGIASQHRALAAALSEESVAAAAERRVPALQRHVDSLHGRLASMRVASPDDIDPAGVLRLLQSLAAESDLSITAFKPLPASAGESLVESAVSVDFEGAYDSLVRFLGSVSDHRALLVVRSLRVRAQDGLSDGVTLAGAARIAWFVPAPLAEAAASLQGAAADSTLADHRTAEGVP
jgi:Tfp pilus assembly protein PilO